MSFSFTFCALSLEGEVNFLAFVADKAHKVVYFFLLGAFAERPSKRQFAMLMKPFPFFAQVRSGQSVHIWPFVR